jgi:hypothetical protein
MSAAKKEMGRLAQEFEDWHCEHIKDCAPCHKESLNRLAIPEMWCAEHKKTEAQYCELIRAQCRMLTEAEQESLMAYMKKAKERDDAILNAC